jgi:hypothetical protein
MGSALPVRLIIILRASIWLAPVRRDPKPAGSSLRTLDPSRQATTAA